MLQVRIEGRGGQGAQLAGQILATTFFREGKYIQSFASFGGARRGAPVSSFLRVDKLPITLHCDIDKPDAILCFDSSLLNETLLEGATFRTKILVNSSKGTGDFKHLGDFDITALNAVNISRAHNLGRIVNSTLMGAFAGLVGAPDIETLLAVIREMSPVKIEENAASCREGYELIKKVKEAV
ncbi:MAG: pyruvate ferredoxin oxidoreductase [Firmicutes bacterium]|nr:pyruvate ferredoxin oxidoreductase [Bacillota bacterium]